MSLVNLFVAARTAIKNRRQQRRAYDELMALDDRSLADIGIHRSQIPAFVMSLEEAVQIEAAPFTGPTGAFGDSGRFAGSHR